MTTHADGIYWVKVGDGDPFLIQHQGREWFTFATADYYIDDYVNAHMTIVAGPLRAPGPRTAEATIAWEGSEVSAELTCGNCGSTATRDIWVGDPIECRQCGWLWRPTCVVSCELVTDAAAIAKFRRDYYGEGR
jgi:hypothetical protein